MKSKISYLLVLFAILGGCKKKSVPVPEPEPAILTFPLQNSSCTTGTVISGTESSISFTWSAAPNTESYELNIKNLLTNANTIQTSTTNQLNVTLLQNAPYSWYVISKSTVTTATSQSDTWKFYNSGPGIISHPPFPAGAVAPVYGQTISATNNAISLGWAGSDVDNDIVGYDIYLGTTDAPGLFTANVSNSYINSVPVIANATYYWKVITKDSQGNISNSGIFKFKTN